MKKIIFILTGSLLLCSAHFFTACKKSDNNTPYPNSSFEVIINNVPFPTEKYMRIGYTIKMWEYEKEGLVLQKIVILNNDSKAELMTIDKADLPKIYKDPLPPNPFFTWNVLTHYYLSIQLPNLLNEEVPVNVTHQFIFKDTLENKEVTMDGALFSPRKDETPLLISSPVIGDHRLFINQSTMGYHFYVLIFIEGEIYSPERFAFDDLQLDPDFVDILEGDPKINESYYNYRDTLFAVADGTVNHLADGRPENSGDAHNITFNTADEYGGNYLILDIGGGHYAFYCHIVPGSYLVSVGEVVQEGDPIALLGNSGNSDLPHLHFHIGDTPDLWHSNGVPFVIKSYTKVVDAEIGPISPEQINNAMMEELSVINIY